MDFDTNENVRAQNENRLSIKRVYCEIEIDTFAQSDGEPVDNEII